MILLGTMLESLGLSTTSQLQGGDNLCINAQHYDEDDEDSLYGMVPVESQDYKVNGRWYQCTGACVRFGINTRGGSK